MWAMLLFFIRVVAESYFIWSFPNQIVPAFEIIPPEHISHHTPFGTNVIAMLFFLPRKGTNFEGVSRHNPPIRGLRSLSTILATQYRQSCDIRIHRRNRNDGDRYKQPHLHRRAVVTASSSKT